MLLEVRNLEVRYGTVPAVRDIDFHVAKGEIVCFIGANGAGKSTTMLAIAGVLRPHRGEIRRTRFLLHFDQRAAAEVDAEIEARMEVERNG